jgi:hypothetical protein
MKKTDNKIKFKYSHYTHTVTHIGETMSAQQQQVPIVLLKEGNSETKGNQAQGNNITAAKTTRRCDRRFKAKRHAQVGRWSGWCRNGWQHGRHGRVKMSYTFFLFLKGGRVIDGASALGF